MIVLDIPVEEVKCVCIVCNEKYDRYEPEYSGEMNLCPTCFQRQKDMDAENEIKPIFEPKKHKILTRRFLSRKPLMHYSGNRYDQNRGRHRNVKRNSGAERY